MKISRLLMLCFLMMGLQVFAQHDRSISKDSTTSFKVWGVCAAICKPRIEAASKGKGVQSTIWNVDTKMLTLVYDPAKTTIEKVQNRILDAGHDVENKKANNADYYALPKCCYYRELKSMKDEKLPADTLNNVSDSTTSHQQANGNVVKGVVVKEDKKGSFIPMEGASIFWLGLNKGTLTDANGIFILPQQGERLVISYTGFLADTISVSPSADIKIILATSNWLQEVKVIFSPASTYINPTDIYRTQNITQNELFKAACCNLSESFETNPSVDVSYNDAVTGSKQIQLLGLAGIYTQLTVENLPGPRGLATSLGLNSIPGAWIESIQLSKGTGSVANGYESIAGQINVELKKPQTNEKLYANIYENDFGKTEANLTITHKLNQKWSTAFLLHDDYYNNKKLDVNKDGFRDLPTGNLFSAVNRWSYNNAKGFISQVGIKILNDEKTGGQINYDESKDKYTTHNYGLAINTKREEVFAKMGYVFPQKKYKSIGLQLSAFNHQQNSYFGFTTYNGNQKNFYSNLIYQSIIHSTRHKFRTGFSFLYDHYNEDFNTNNYKRTELVPGAFFEYTFTPSAKFNLVAGIREDHNSLYGWFTTPRINARYQPFKNTAIRLSIGRGERTANIFAENNAVFASSREIMILPSTTRGAYGLQPEIAWNKGITIDQKFRLFNKPASLGLDFYRNDFTSQVVVDIEDPKTIRFYNLTGKSYSNSFQSELSFTPLQKLDVRLAYRLFDVKTTYGTQLLQKPLLSPNRAFANLAYERKGWKWDYTVSYSSRKRLPSTAANPVEYQRSNYSPSFVTMNAQVSKTLGKKNLFDVYTGAENLTNYYQKNAIIAASQPFSQYFDASLIWGPITGRMFYAGLRLRIK